MKTASVRLSEDQMDLVEAIASVDGCTTAEVLRAAVAVLIRERVTADKTFLTTANKIIERRFEQTRGMLSKELGNVPVQSGGTPRILIV